MCIQAGISPYTDNHIVSNLKLMLITFMLYILMLINLLIKDLLTFIAGNEPDSISEILPKAPNFPIS